MADKKTPSDPTSSAGDGSPTSETAGTTPSATAFTPIGEAPATPEALPSAAIEPEAQVAAAAAAPLKAPVPNRPPSASTAPDASAYRMPDDYATESLFDKTKAWVEANPGLAILAFAGAGLVVGRLVTALVPDPEPETLAERVEKRAREIGKDAEARGRKAAKTARKQTSSLIDDAVSAVEDRTTQARKAARSFADDATDSARDAAKTARDAASEGTTRAHDLAETIADTVKSAIDEWVDRVRK